MVVYGLAKSEGIYVLIQDDINDRFQNESKNVRIDRLIMYFYIIFRCICIGRIVSRNCVVKNPHNLNDVNVVCSI